MIQQPNLLKTGLQQPGLVCICSVGCRFVSPSVGTVAVSCWLCIKFVHLHGGMVRFCFVCRSEDDLTHKLAEIIKANNKLKRQDQNGAPQHIIREFSQLLQFHITTYFDNTKPGQPVAAQVCSNPLLACMA